MRSNRLLILFLLSSMTSAAVISKTKHGGGLIFKTPLTNQARQTIIKDVDYRFPIEEKRNELKIEKTTVIKDSILSVSNKSLELSKLLRKGNLYSLLRSIHQRQYCPPYTYCPPDAPPTTTPTPTTTPYIPTAALIVGLGVIAAATAIGVGVGVGVPASIEAPEPLDITVARFACRETPENNLDIPVDGPGIPDNGCGNSSVRFGGNTLGSGTSVQPFGNGFCAPLLRRGPCTSPFEWVTIDPSTFQVLLTDYLYPDN